MRELGKRLRLQALDEMTEALGEVVEALKKDDMVEAELALSLARGRFEGLIEAAAQAGTTIVLRPESDEGLRGIDTSYYTE